MFQLYILHTILFFTKIFVNYVLSLFILLFFFTFSTHGNMRPQSLCTSTFKKTELYILLTFANEQTYRHFSFVMDDKYIKFAKIPSTITCILNVCESWLIQGQFIQFKQYTTIKLLRTTTTPEAVALILADAQATRIMSP